MLYDDTARACRLVGSQPRPGWPRPGTGTSVPRERGAPSPGRRVPPIDPPVLVPMNAESNAEDNPVMACASGEMDAIEGPA